MAPGTTSEWELQARQRVERAWETRQNSDLGAHKSLRLCTQLRHERSHGCHPYLDDRSNIPGTRIKTYLRLGTTLTMEQIASSLKSPGFSDCCLMCNTGQTEDQCHLYVQCPAVREHFRLFLKSLRVNMQRFGAPGMHIVSRV